MVKRFKQYLIETLIDDGDLKEKPKEDANSGSQPTSSGSQPTSSGPQPTNSGSQPTSSGSQPMSSGPQQGNNTPQSSGRKIAITPEELKAEREANAARVQADTEARKNDPNQAGDYAKAPRRSDPIYSGEGGDAKFKDDSMRFAAGQNREANRTKEEGQSDAKYYGALDKTYRGIKTGADTFLSVAANLSPAGKLVNAVTKVGEAGIAYSQGENLEAGMALADAGLPFAFSKGTGSLIKDAAKVISNPMNAGEVALNNSQFGTKVTSAAKSALEGLGVGEKLTEIGSKTASKLVSKTAGSNAMSSASNAIKAGGTNKSNETGKIPTPADDRALSSSLTSSPTPTPSNSSLRNRLPKA